jgi:H+/Cl- antiporter ClcA
MDELRTHRAKLLAQVVFWLALGVGLGVAFGDSLGRAVLWIAVAVAIGLVVRNRGQIAARIGRRRPRDRP